MDKPDIDKEQKHLDNIFKLATNSIKLLDGTYVSDVFIPYK